MPIMQRYGMGKNDVLELYDLRETEEILHLSRNTLSRYINDNRLPTVTLNKKKYISKRNIYEFLNGARGWGTKPGYYRRKEDTIKPTFTEDTFSPLK